jgi:hypothetical protein
VKTKGSLALLLGTKEPDEDDKPDEEDTEGFDTAADECFDALKAGDKEGFRAALKSALEMC